MEKLLISNKWNDVKRKIKNVYPTVTEEDLAFEPGKEEQILDRLQKKTGKDREKIAAWIEHLHSTSL